MSSKMEMFKNLSIFDKGRNEHTLITGLFLVCSGPRKE